MSFRVAARSSSRSARLPAGPGSRRSLTVAQQAQQHQSHIAAGVAGGAAVVLAGYAWYHFSGTKEVVATARSFQQQIKSVKDGATSVVPDASSVLKMTRSVVQSSAAAIPGASYLVDRLFDQADEIAKEHGPEVEKALRQTYDEVSQALKSGENSGEKVLAIVVANLRNLSNLAADQFTPLLDSNPQLKSALQEPLKQFRALADQHGEKAQKLYNDLSSDLTKLTSKGLNASTLTDASSLVQKRLQQAQQLAQEAGEDAWRRAQSEAGPLMDKVSKDLSVLGKGFEKQLDSLRETIGPEGSKTVERAYQQLREIATTKGSAKDTLAKAQKVVDETMRSLKEVAQNKSGDVIKLIPGVDKVPELAELSALLSQRGPEAERLLKSTVEDVRKVLRQRLDEGKSLGEQTARDVQKKF